MKSNRDKTSSSPRGRERGCLGDEARRWLRWGSGLVAVVAAGVLLHQRFSAPSSNASGLAVIFGTARVSGKEFQAASPTRLADAAATMSTARKMSPRIRDWVERLSQPAALGPLTIESAAAWDEILVRLIASGPEAVPAIREFLARNADNEWDAGARRVLGYDSARTAMFDALRQIGGTEAEAALAATLAETLSPREIALLARNLELMAPGRHRQAAVDAARQSLATEAIGIVGAQDVAPLFEVLDRFGGDTVATDLEGAAVRWNYYSAIALAQLPDGAGVSTLVRLADGTNSITGRAADPAIQMLGSMATHNEEARAAFLDLARNDRIATSTWGRLGPILAGAEVQFSAGVFGGSASLDHGAGAQQIHLSQGNQNIWTGLPAVAASAEHWEKQLVWLDQLAAIATGPAAQAAIQEAWKLILVRLSPLTASVP